MGGSINQHFYDGKSNKTDYNIYVKTTYKLTEKLDGFVDLQERVMRKRNREMWHLRAAPMRKDAHLANSTYRV